MKAKIARRILRKNHLAMVRKEHFCPSMSKRIKEAIRVVVKEEVKE